MKIKSTEGVITDVQLDPQDTWSMYTTLSAVILPMLIQLKATTHGAPEVAAEDVPVHLRGLSTIQEQATDTWFKRWDWVMDEMIWAFTEIQADRECWGMDSEVVVSWDARVQRGTELFGKYYRNLWD